MGSPHRQIAWPVSWDRRSIQLRSPSPRERGERRRHPSDRWLGRGSRRRRLFLEELVVVMPRHDPALDLRVDRVCAPPPVPQILIKADRRALGIAQVEIEDRQAEFPGETLDFAHYAAAETASARPGSDEGAGQGSRERLRLVVARCPAELRRAGDDTVEPADDEPALGNEQHALPVIFQYLPRRWPQPTKAAALSDGTLGSLAEIVEIGARELGQPIEGDGPGSLQIVHGRQRRKFPINRSPASWLFSGWNCVPARLSFPMTAAR